MTLASLACNRPPLWALEHDGLQRTPFPCSRQQQQPTTTVRISARALIYLLLAVALVLLPCALGAPVCLPIAQPGGGSLLPATPTKALLFEGTGVGGDAIDAVTSAYVFDVDDVRLQRSVTVSADTALQDYAAGRCDVALLANQVPRALSGLVQLPVAAYGIDIVYTMAGGSSMAIIDGLALFGQIWSGAINRWDDPALTASSGATPDMLPAGSIRLVVERFANGSLDAEAASLGAVFGRALANASEAFSAAYAQHGSSMSATVLATAGANRTLVVDPVAWAAAGPGAVAGVTTDPLSGALLFESVKAALAAAGDGAMAYVVAGDPDTAAYPRPFLVNRAGRVFFGFSSDSVYAALDAYNAAALRDVPYDTGVVDLYGSDSSDAWPIVGIVTAVLRTDVAPAGYDCQYGEVALGLLAWMQINDGALAATLASGTLSPLSASFRQRATDAMGSVALCPRSANATADNDPSASARVAATALVGAGTTTLVWSAWMQAYTSRTTRLKLAGATEEQAVTRLAAYGVDFAATSSGMSDLSPVQAAACADCVSVPVAVRPYAPIYNVPEIARAASSLVLDAHLLAGIFLGRIDMWNHSELAEANPALAPLLPARPIVVVLAKGDLISGAGGPLGGVANRFAAEYMAADAAFRTEVLNGSSTTVGRPSLVYPIESTAPTRVVKAGLVVASSVKSQLYALGIDAVEAALAARNLRVASLRGAGGAILTPSADAIATAVADFVWPDLLPRIPPRRADTYERRGHASDSGANHARATTSDAFAGLPSMMVGAASAGAWPLVGWHHAYMHGASMPDCAKATGLVDALYWTQSSEAGATVAAAQGLATTARAVGPNAVPRILAALANVTCTTSDGERQSALSVAPCIYVTPGAVDTIDAMTLCAGHGECVTSTAANPASASSSSLTTRIATSAAGAKCVCRSGWKGAWCETVDDSSANPGGGASDGNTGTALIVGVVVATIVVVCCGAIAVAVLVIAIALVRHRGARRRALDSGYEIDMDEITTTHSLGSGATSEVFDGTWRGTRVAVKRFRSPARGWDRAALAAFGEEVRVMCALRHPNVVMFMGASMRPPVLAIVMEHMALGSLRDVLNNELLVQIPFKLKVAIAHQTAKGMHFLHSSGISHGDLKSLNILITEKWQAKVSDFGLSSMRSGDTHNSSSNNTTKGVAGSDGQQQRQQQQQQHNLGTVHWAAPERILWASGGDEADVQAADVYSFGVVLWELLTRESPYRGCSPAAVQVAVMRDGMRPDAHAARAALAAEGVDTFDAARYDPEDDISAAIECEGMPRAIVASYVGLYRTCWDTEPAARPTFLGVLGELGELAGRVHDARPYGASDSSSSSNTQHQSYRPRTHDHAGDGSRTAETLTGASGSEATTATDEGNNDDGHHDINNGLAGRGFVAASGRRKAGRAPDGMVVIALADIAHAATLWETVPDAMSAATLVFAESMRRLTARYGGHESAQAGRTTASLFCAVFVDPCAAVAWAAAAQRLLASDETTWPADLLACPEAAVEYPVTASTADIESGRARPIYRGLRVRMTLHHGHVRRISCEPGRRPEYDGEGLKEALRLTPRVRGGHVLVTEAMCRHLLERPRAVVERCLASAGRLERAGGGSAFGDSRAQRRARFAAGAADIISGTAATAETTTPSDDGQRRARMSRPVSALSLTMAPSGTANGGKEKDDGEDEMARLGALAWQNIDWLLRACDKARARMTRSTRAGDTIHGHVLDNDGDDDDDDGDDRRRAKDDTVADNEDSDGVEDGRGGSDEDEENIEGGVGRPRRPLLCQLRVAQLDGRWTDHALLAAATVHNDDDDNDDSGQDSDGESASGRGQGVAGAHGRAWGDGRRAELAYVDSANMCRAVIDPRTLKMGRVIGSGSFATVYRANWHGAEVAVKRLARARLTERDVCQFRAEMMLHAKLEHPNVLPLFGACLQEGNLCLVTEYVARGTLRELLASPEGGRLGWEIRLRMLRHAARGVAYLHARSPPIVHRDLKPANLLVGDDHRVKVADFGLARVKEEGATMTASRGTRAYAAPEVLLSRPYTEKVDVYAMGLIMWAVLTRREPFADRGPRDAEVYADIIGGTRPPVPPDAPADFVALMARCWNNNPSRRPTMQTVVEALTVMIGDGDDVEIGLA